MGNGQRVIPGHLLHRNSPTGHGTWPGVSEPLLGPFVVAHSTCHLIHDICFQKLCVCLAWVQDGKAEAFTKLT